MTRGSQHRLVPDLACAIAVVAMSGIGFLLALGVVLAVAHRDASWLLTQQK